MRLKILLVLPFVIIATGLVLFASNTPIQDDYDAILNFLNYPWPERFFHLADFHNEHRIIPTRLVSELVYRALGHIDFRAVMWIGNCGWWLFAAVFAWLFARHGGFLRWGAVFAVWMLVGFYDQENTFWAMTSIQNHWVIAFAFASCLAFSRRSELPWFIASLVFAVAATFTSGGGLLTFPALALMALCTRIFRGGSSLSRRQWVFLISFIIVATVSIVTFLHGIRPNDDPSLMISKDPIKRATGAIAFFFSFFGNLIPLYWMPHAWPVCVAGVVVVGWGCVICWFAPRYRASSLAVFGFLAFSVANILAASVCRGSGAVSALSGRYQLISAAIIVSLLYLTLVDIPLNVRYKRLLLKLGMIGSFILSAYYLSHGIPQNSTHKTSLESGIAQWQYSYDGLHYPTNRLGRAHAAAVLKESVKRGVYIPPCVKP